MRQRAGGWAVFHLVVGTLLIAKLGAVGVWIGVVLVVLGVFRGWELVQSFLHPPGTIVVSDREVVLPRGLCLSRPVVIEPARVTAAYFLRRSVPWNRSAPVLVVELGRDALAFPRDWFASEADQRHVLNALVQRMPDAGALPSAAEAASDGEPYRGVTTAKPAAPIRIDPAYRSPWVDMAGGAVLVGIGVIGSAMGQGESAGGGRFALYLAPIVAGAIVFWRGFARR